MGDNAVAPKLVISDAASALDYYRAALSATEVVRYEHDGKIVFAELDVLGTRVTLKDDDATDRPSEPGPILDVTVDDPDAVAEAMVRGGGAIVFKVSARPWGGRWGRVRDPYGIQWLLQSPDASDPTEVQAILDATG